MQDLKTLLEEASIVEQKAFLKSFIERIEVDDSELKGGPINGVRLFNHTFSSKEA